MYWIIRALVNALMVACCQEIQSYQLSLTTVANTSRRRHGQILRNVSCQNGSQSCPPWSKCDANGGCDCIKLPGHPLACDLTTGPSSEPHLYILDCYCITYQISRSLIEVGQCNYNCARHVDSQLMDMVYQPLPQNLSSWNDFMCGPFERSGSLCGSCSNDRDYYPRAYSFNLSCIECKGTNFHWLKYILLAYGPLTVFYLIIFFFRVDIQSSQLQGFVLFSQLISTPALCRNLLLTTNERPHIQHLVRVVGSIYGIWNLDFFRAYNNDICFRISSLSVLFLDLIIALNPLFLMLVTYILIKIHDQDSHMLAFIWKPFRVLQSNLHRSFSARSSLINAFAAFFFLTHMKMFNFCFDMLTPVKIYQFKTPQEVEMSWRLYYNPDIIYFSSEHRKYAIAALIILVCVVISPVTLLLFYSNAFFQKAVDRILPIRWKLFLHTYIDSFQGCYKDGTELGTRDCRWYVQFLYLTRLFLIVSYGISLNATFFSYGAIVMVAVGITTIIVDPFKSHLQSFSATMATFILLLAAFYVCAAGVEMVERKGSSKTMYAFYAQSVAISLLPLLYIAGFAILKIINLIV